MGLSSRPFLSLPFYKKVGLDRFKTSTGARYSGIPFVGRFHPLALRAMNLVRPNDARRLRGTTFQVSKLSEPPALGVTGGMSLPTSHY